MQLYVQHAMSHVSVLSCPATGAARPHPQV